MRDAHEHVQGRRTKAALPRAYHALVRDIERVRDLVLREPAGDASLGDAPADLELDLEHEHEATASPANRTP